MKLMMMIISLLIVFSVSNSQAAACLESDVELAEAFVARSHNNLLPKYELLWAEISLIDMKFCAEKIGKREYCDQKGQKLTELLAIFKRPNEEWFGSYDQIARILKKMENFRRTCN